MGHNNKVSEKTRTQRSVDPDPVRPSPFEHFTAEQWSRIAQQAPLPLSGEDIERIASLGDPITLEEVDDIYRPLSALLRLYVDGAHNIGAEQRRLLQEPQRPPTPFVIGIAGSVAVGKSTVARLLQLLLSRLPNTPKVDLVTTDGFLLPNAELTRLGLMGRKGFPDSYDQTALLDFVAQIKSGNTRVTAPVYSHVTYDVLPDEEVVVESPDVLIIEGLNVLQPARTGHEKSGVALADYFDFKIYIDANPGDIESWYVSRFLQLRKTAFTEPDSYFKDYAQLSDTEARSVALDVWRSINLPNLESNIAPTRPRATLILRKGADHAVQNIYLRRI